MGSWTMMLAICCMLAPFARAQDSGPQRVEDSNAGIALDRPAGWFTATARVVEEKSRRIRVADPELQAAVGRGGTAPLFVFTKHPETHPGVNPKIQVTLRPAWAAGPAEMLKGILPGLQKAYPSLRIDEDVDATQLSGLPAAHMRFSFTARSPDGTEFAAVSRLWLVSRGASVFLIAMTGPPQGPDVSEEEFARTLASISIYN